MRILFDSKLSQFKTPFGTLTPKQVCTVHIHIPCACRTTAVALVLQAENGAELLFRFAPGEENLQELREALDKGFPGARLVSWPGK